MNVRTPAPALLLLLALFAVSAAAEPQPPFMNELFPPELIMRHGRDIGLSKEQRSAITSAVGETQAQTLELQWEMQDAAQSLAKQLRASRVDEAAALDVVGRVMDIEGQVKRAHFRLLIRIKNSLSAEQQQQLRDLRARGEAGMPPR